MADKNMKKPKGVNSTDWNVYLNALDEIEKRPMIEEVEEVMANHRKELEEEAPFVGNWEGNPIATDLGSLLIVPEEVEAENHEEAHNLASLLLSHTTQDENGDNTAKAPVDLRNPLAVLGALIFPRRGDSATAVAIKSSILLTLVALLAAVALLLNYLVLMPYANRQLNHELFELYDPESTMTVADTTRYPAGMLASFKELYTRNQDVRGWLCFHSSGDKDFINVEYPVVQTDNNKTYVSTDFDKNKNKNGTLFFDQKCEINGVQDTSRVLMVYGNSTGNGQMLSGLTNLMGSVNNARAATVFTLSTLYEKADYYVMAVVLVDGKGDSLNYKRTVFADEQDFFSHVQMFRDRSLFDYSTDLQEGDQLAIIGTNVSAAASNMSDARLLVLGRRQRPGESASLSNVTKNEDVIMPYKWYFNQKITPHEYYYQDDTDTESTESTETNVSDITQTETTVDASATVTDGSTVGEDTTAVGDTTTGEESTAGSNTTTGSDTTAGSDTTTGEDTTTSKDTTTGEDSTTEDSTTEESTKEDTTTDKESTTDKDATTVATGGDDPNTTVNKNTYTTSHTYTEEPTTTTSRSVPTGMIITKVPLSTASTEKEETTSAEETKETEDTTETTTTETTKPQE